MKYLLENGPKRAEHKLIMNLLRLNDMSNFDGINQRDDLFIHFISLSGRFLNVKQVLNIGRVHQRCQRNGRKHLRPGLIRIHNQSLSGSPSTQTTPIEFLSISKSTVKLGC